MLALGIAQILFVGLFLWTRAVGPSDGAHFIIVIAALHSNGVVAEARGDNPTEVQTEDLVLGVAGRSLTPIQAA